MKKLLLLLLALLLIPSVSAAYWNTSFQQRQCITITNSGSVAWVQNTTLNFSMDTQQLIADGLMRSDCRDLRIIQNDANEINYTIGAPRFGERPCNNRNTSIIFRTLTPIAVGSTNEYCAYYNNSVATNVMGDDRSGYLSLNMSRFDTDLHDDLVSDTSYSGNTKSFSFKPIIINSLLHLSYSVPPNYMSCASGGSPSWGTSIVFGNASDRYGGIECFDPITNNSVNADPPPTTTWVGGNPKGYKQTVPFINSSSWYVELVNFSSTSYQISNLTNRLTKVSMTALNEITTMTFNAYQYVYYADGSLGFANISAWNAPETNEFSYSLLAAEGSAGVKFTGETPANNSMLYALFPFTINVSVSGFNYTRAFLNFSGSLSNNSMEQMSVQNTTTVILALLTPTGQHGLFTLNNDSVANLSVTETRTGGSATANVTLNGVVIGTLGASGTYRFDGWQNQTVKGNNLLGFVRTAGGAGDTMTITLSQLNFSKKDYEFGFAFNLTPGTYNYSYTVLSEGQTFTTGTRFITVQANVSPAWSNAFTTPTSPATYSPTATYNFNVTWTDLDLSIVRMIHNFAGTITNTTVSSATTAFNYAFGAIAAGNYSWRQSANDTQRNTNVTTNFSFVVLQAASFATLTIGGSNGTNVSQASASTAVINATRITGTGNMSLIADGVFNQSTSGNNIAINYTFYANRTYPFTVTIDESQNYTAFSVTHTAIVPPPPVFNETGFLTAGSCPTDSIPNVMMYVFLIALLFAMIFLSEKVETTQPFKGGVMVLVGMGIIAHAVTTLYCSSIIGIVEMVFALMLMIFGAARIWRG